MTKREEDIEKVINFLYQYDYNEYERFGVLFSIFSEEKSSFDISAQIRAYLNFDKGYKNSYMGYLHLLMKYFNLGRDIVEIGAGNFPVMAHYIDKEQIKIKNGTITAYDPKLVISDFGNINLQKTNFTLDTNIKKTSLLLGIRPCDASKLIIQKAFMEESEFFITMCFCPPYNGDYRPLYEFAKKYSEPRSEIIVDNLPLEYGKMGSAIIKKKY